MFLIGRKHLKSDHKHQDSYHLLELQSLRGKTNHHKTTSAITKPMPKYHGFQYLSP